jgi:hypothetical protein
VRLVDFQVVTGSKSESEPKRSDGFVARGKRTGQGSAPQGPVARPSGGRNRAIPSRAGGSPFDAALREAHLELSLIVAEASRTWDFDDVRGDVELLVRSGSTTLERGRAQRLLEQIEEFEDLQIRFQTLNVPANPLNERTTGDARLASESVSGVDPRFDGSGWLLPVHSKKRTAPPYALLDGDGRLLQFVSPSPGLNLHRYLRKEIGIFGQRTFIPSLDKPHVTAHRVVDLQRHRR